MKSGVGEEREEERRSSPEEDPSSPGHSSSYLSGGSGRVVSEAAAGLGVVQAHPRVEGESGG